MKQFKMKKWILLGWLLCLALIIFGLSGCNNAGADTDPATTLVRPVKAMLLETPKSETVRSFPGTAQATREVNLAFRVAGPLVKLNGDTGDKVSKGALIAQIDSRDFRVQIKTLEAKVASSKAQYAQSKLQYERYTNLVKVNAAAKATYDQVKATFEMARAQVNSDQKNLESARNALTDTDLFAPFTGYINQKLVENHENITMGQSIISLVDLSSIEVEVAIPENLVGNLDRFIAYSCEFEAIPGKIFKAVFNEIGKKPNRSNQTYPLTLTLDPGESSVVRPGMSARISITIAGKNQDTIFRVPPQSLVNDAQGRTFVWIVDETDKKIHKRFVQTGGLRHRGVEVITGLNTGDWLVTAGASYLKEGQATRILQTAVQTNVGNAL